MQLTSEQIARKTFVIRAQGYDRDEVEAFLRLLAEQAPSAADDGSVAADAHAEAERVRSEAEQYARHVRESADAYAVQIREAADHRPRPRFSEPSLITESAGGPTPAFPPASYDQSPGATTAALSASTEHRSLHIPAPTPERLPVGTSTARSVDRPSIDPAGTPPAAAPAPTADQPIEAPVASGLPSSGMAALDSLVDDVMSDVMAGFRSGSGTPLR